MKTMLCCLFAILFVFICGTAFADDLSDVWYEYTGSSFENWSAYGFDQVKNIGRRIGTHTIGQTADFFMYCNGSDDGGSLEDLIDALAYNGWTDVPLLREIADEISATDITLLDSLLLAWENSESHLVATQEFYQFDITIYRNDGEQEYEILVVCCTEAEGGEYVDYTILNENFYYYEFDDSDFDEYLGDMYVINCNEWVSLRVNMSSDSPRLTKVPLGALVEDVYIIHSEDFAFCTYKGQSGFIMREYLGYNPPDINNAKEENSPYGILDSGYSDYWVSLSLNNCIPSDIPLYPFNAWEPLVCTVNLHCPQGKEVQLGYRFTASTYGPDHFEECEYVWPFSWCNGTSDSAYAHFPSFEKYGSDAYVTCEIFVIENGRQTAIGHYSRGAS